MDLVSFKDAKDAGLKFYFTGKPCKRGHIAVRYVNDCMCAECKTMHRKAWRAANPERARELDRRSDKDRRKERWRACYARNPEKYKAKTKRFYEKNGAAIRKKRMEYHHRTYKENADARGKAADRKKKWAIENPDRIREHSRNDKARRKNAKGKHTAKDVAEIILMQKGKCAYCRVKLGKKYHVDHILALARGGTNERKNLQITCADCNLAKGARDPIFHAQTLGMLL